MTYNALQYAVTKLSGVDGDDGADDAGDVDVDENMDNSSASGVSGVWGDDTPDTPDSRVGRWHAQARGAVRALVGMCVGASAYLPVKAGVCRRPGQFVRAHGGGHRGREDVREIWPMALQGSRGVPSVRALSPRWARC